MNTYQQSTLAAYRAYASKLAGDKAELMTRTEQVEQAALRVLRAVADCASDEDALKLFEGGRLLGFTGEEKESMDSILALWDLVRPKGEVLA